MGSLFGIAAVPVAAVRRVAKLPTDGSLRIDGSYGEGGGQIVRSAVALAAATGRNIRIDGIRLGRRNPGLAPQHLTAVRAAAAVCGAALEGDVLGSTALVFSPQHPAQVGDYAFDVGAAREGGSAGSAPLVLQTVLPPLALASGDTNVTVRGGTHLPWSPSYDYLHEVWLPAMTPMGVTAEVDLSAWGWDPLGQGELRARIHGHDRRLAPVHMTDRGALVEVRGRAVAANLPAHIPQRMADRARSLLAAAGIAARISPLRLRAACPGAGLFLTVVCEGCAAGFSALGARGRPSEEVAEEAVAALLVYRDSGATADIHLADQLIVPACLAKDESRWLAERATEHLRTAAWLAAELGLAEVAIDPRGDGRTEVRVVPR